MREHPMIVKCINYNQITLISDQETPTVQARFNSMYLLNQREFEIKKGIALKASTVQKGRVIAKKLSISSSRT